MKRALIGLPITFLVAACANGGGPMNTSGTGSIDQIHPGMDRSQVVALLGQPQTTNNTAGQECAVYTVMKEFWARVPWDMTDRYYICFNEGKVTTFGRTNQQPS